jgi:hypothetical protein
MYVFVLIDTWLKLTNTYSEALLFFFHFRNNLVYITVNQLHVLWIWKKYKSRMINVQYRKILWIQAQSPVKKYTRFPVLHFSVVIFSQIFGIIDCSTLKVLNINYRSSRFLGAWGMLHFFIIPHVQTQSNRVSNFHVNVLLLIFSRDSPFSRFVSLYCRYFKNKEKYEDDLQMKLNDTLQFNNTEGK